MPIIVCECKAGLAVETKRRIAAEVTAQVQVIIQSPLDLISVVFHELAEGNSFRSGVEAQDTLIFCHIRDGRSDAAVLALAKAVSRVWSEVTGDAEDGIEVAVQLYPARFVVRGGERLPEAPRV